MAIEAFVILNILETESKVTVHTSAESPLRSPITTCLLLIVFDDLHADPTSTDVNQSTSPDSLQCNVCHVFQYHVHYTLLYFFIFFVNHAAAAKIAFCERNKHRSQPPTYIPTNPDALPFKEQ